MANLLLSFLCILLVSVKEKKRPHFSHIFCFEVLHRVSPVFVMDILRVFPKCKNQNKNPVCLDFLKCFAFFAIVRDLEDIFGFFIISESERGVPTKKFSVATCRRSHTISGLNNSPEKKFPQMMSIYLMRAPTSFLFSSPDNTWKKSFFFFYGKRV